MNKPLFSLLFIVLYVVGTYYSIYLSASPAQECIINDNGIDSHCLKPLITPSHKLNLELWIYSPKLLDADQERNNTAHVSKNLNFQWNKVESCGTFLIDLHHGTQKFESKNCTILLPNSARERNSIPHKSKVDGKRNRRYESSAKPLEAKFVLRFSHDSLPSTQKNDRFNGKYAIPARQSVVSEAYFELTRMVEMKDPVFNGKNTASNANEVLLVPHYKYRNQHVVLRFVAEYRNYGSVFRSDGIAMKRYSFSTNNRFHNFYRPIFYVDDNSLLYKSHITLAPPLPGHNTSVNIDHISPNTNVNSDSNEVTIIPKASKQKELKPKPPVNLSIKFSIISPERDVINKHMSEALQVIESFLHPSEIDEIKYFIRDENVYRFLLTQLISIVHVYFDYLAFRDEVHFYQNKTSMAGISLSSILTNLLCSIILFLYLLDGGGTSGLVLITIGGEICVQGWKILKIIQPCIHVRTTFPYVFIEMNSFHTPETKRTSDSDQIEQNSGISKENHDDNETVNSYILQIESKTKEYDRIAVTYLTLILYPIILGTGLYALKFESYTSYYSCFISNMANAVYTFGFIALCPQLYVNYRLKSVAHLPWRVFMYKIFNTFIDDIFAFLISMPWKHRLMTLRDDVVFVAFLYQTYIYRVDKARPNEFGYVYENVEAKSKVQSSSVNIKTQNDCNKTDIDDTKKMKLGHHSKLE